MLKLAFLYSVHVLEAWSSILNLTSKTNIALYWGQNSYGGQNQKEIHNYEKELDFFCDKKSENNQGDVIMLSFLSNFNANKDNRLPEINLSNHCDTFYQEGPTYLRKCHHIGSAINKCQKNNKIIILSLGGASANTDFANKKSATKFAHTIWNMFLGGNHTYRPLGEAKLDGVDLDIEGGSPEHYDTFVQTLRKLFDLDRSKQYYISAAPQCPFPDAMLHKTMSKTFFDMIFIQYYNNWCGIHNFHNKWAFNWNQWVEWAQNESYNKNIKLFLGIPAAKSAASFGYIEEDALEEVIMNVSQTKYFGGVMVWDASQSQNNKINGIPFLKYIKQMIMRITSDISPPASSTSFESNSPRTSYESTSSINSRTLNLSSSIIHTSNEKKTTKQTYPTNSDIIKSTTSNSQFTTSETSHKSRTSESNSPSSTKSQTKATSVTTTSNRNAYKTYNPPVDHKPYKSTPYKPKTDNGYYPYIKNGGVCHITGALACSGNYFATCNHGYWIFRKCPNDQICYSSYGSIYCGHKISH